MTLTGAQERMRAKRLDRQVVDPFVGVRARALPEGREHHAPAEALQRVGHGGVAGGGGLRGEVDVEGDAAHFGGAQAIDRVGVQRARPGPAAHFGQAACVDLDDRDLARGGPVANREPAGLEHVLKPGAEPQDKGHQPSNKRRAQDEGAAPGLRAAPDGGGPGRQPPPFPELPPLSSPAFGAS
jgi:hypothetical protein